MLTADRIAELREEYECETVYDYAASGGECRPKIADLVTCSGVLDGVNDVQVIDDVLAKAERITGKVAVFTIASQYNADWWRAKFSGAYFVVACESKDGGEIEAIVSPIREIMEIRGKSAVTPELRSKQAFRNCAAVEKRVLAKMFEPRHDKRVCVAGFGPSLKDTWLDIYRERRAFGATVVSTSGAHDFLIEKGIVPDIHIEVDPREHKAFFTRNPHPDVKYWIASCCHPVLIDNLVAKGCDVGLWHLLNSDEDYQIVSPGGPDPNGWLVCGGSGVAARAVNLMFTQGYRSFSLHGMDCSFAKADGVQHAGDHSGKLQKEWNVRVGGHWFRSSATLVFMARAMIMQMRVLQREAKGEPPVPGTSSPVEFLLHGNGFLQALAEETNRRDAEAKAA
jgi:hypothetical protein